MLPAHKIRASPNHGRYLFHNRVLRLAVGGVDLALELVRSPSPSLLTANPGKILVCNQAHIGDVIWASSALPVLRAAFPQARIGFLVHPASTVVLTGNPYVEWVHNFEHWKLNRRRTSFLQKLKSAIGSGKMVYFAKTCGFEIEFIGGEAEPILGDSVLHFLRMIIFIPVKACVEVVARLLFFPSAKMAFYSSNMVVVLKKRQASPETDLLLCTSCRRAASRVDRNSERDRRPC
jgi:hypothetical protein